MEESAKSQSQLIEELTALRQQVADLQAERRWLRQVNQEPVQESEILFRILAETTSAAIFIFQGTKNCYVNPATEAITGYRQDELLAMNFWDVVHPDFHAFIKERGLARQRGERVPARYEVKILTKNGEERWLDFTGGLVEFQGQPAVLGTAFDITSRKQAEEERERLLAAEREQRLLAETLREVCLVLAAQTNPETVLDEILRQMQRLVHYNTANITLLEGDYLRIVRWQGYEKFGCEELIAYLKQPLSDFPVLAQIVRSRQTLLIANTKDHPSWVPVTEWTWIKSYIGVPICSQQRVLGVLQIDADMPYKFSAKDGERLQPLAYAAAIALENARLYEQIRQDLIARRQIEAEIVQRNAELLTLQFAAATLASSLELPFILDTFTTEMAHLLGAQSCVISEWNRTADTITVIAEQGLPQQPPKKTLAKAYPLTKFPLARWVLNERRAQQISLNQTDKMPYLPARSVGSLLLLPMEFQNNVVGLIEIIDDRPERIFTTEEIALSQMLANQAASALQNAHLYAEVKRRLKQQIALQAATTEISSTLDLNSVLCHIAEQIGQAVEVTSAYICSYEAETMTSVVLAEYFSPYASTKERVSDLGAVYPLPRDFSTAFDRLQAGQPEEIHWNNTNETRRGHMYQFGVKTILNIPLQLGGQTIAFAELWESRHKRQFTLEEIVLCQGIAQQAAIALEHARLYAQAQQEIKERMRAEAELRQSETRQRALLEAIPDAMFRVTRLGTCLDYHQGSQLDPIWPAQMQTGQSLANILPVEIADLALSHIAEALDSGVSQVFEFRWRLPHHFQEYETRLEVSGPDEVLGIVRNITERKQMEKQAIQAERLAALGRLSAALTHEINNPLQSIRTHLDLMLDFALEPGEDKKFLRIMRQEVERLNEITRRILNLARPWPVSRRRVVVIDLLKDVLTLADRQLKQHRIQITTEWQEVAPILAAPDQLIQVFLNLIINAIEATPVNGRFHVAVRSDHEQVIVSFVNSGPAIPLDILPHIFEPFFTTKAEGSGLGLWVSDSLVRQHGGSIIVENLGGNEGVAFTVTLPNLSMMEAIDDNGYGQPN